MNKNISPLVSILMTAYNREKYIAEAIESVLASTYQNWELIIVDDCSKDRTVEIAKSYTKIDNRIKVFVNQNNLGDYLNRNKAASFAAGEYIKYLDSDDIIYPHGLEVMIRSMVKFPEAGFGLSSTGIPNSPFPVCIAPKRIYLEHFYFFNHFDRAPGSSIIKLKAFNAVNGFTGKRMIGDYELWFKMARYFSMVKFQRDLVWDRVHSEQESKSDYSKLYGKLRKQIFREAIENKDCPLSTSEIKLIKRRVFTKKVKNNIIKLLKVKK